MTRTLPAGCKKGGVTARFGPPRTTLYTLPTCLVTGGAGFLGSHLCDELLRRGHRVICADNLETGSLANIAHIRDPEVRFDAASTSSSRTSSTSPWTSSTTLASPASPIDYLRLPLHTLKVGSHGTHHTLGLAKRHRARFLIFSTSEVYGDPEVHPQPETYWGNVNPIGPRGVYDEAKRYAEALTMAYHRQQGVDTAIVRIFNTYGAAHAPARRPRDPDLPAPGALRSPDHHLRRRLADAQLHLRRRPRSPASSPWPSPASTTRSTSATPTSTRCCSWPRRSSRSRARARSSSTRRCPSTTRRCASPTSRVPASCSAGSPRCRCTTACDARSTRPESTCSSAP